MNDIKPTKPKREGSHLPTTGTVPSVRASKRYSDLQYVVLTQSGHKCVLRGGRGAGRAARKPLPTYQVTLTTPVIPYPGKESTVSG